MTEKTFIDDKSFLNLEIGAGCGNFGKLFYPECYLTDFDTELPKKCNSCHIDWFCPAHELTWSDNRFDKVILCNPYGYGFRDIEESEILMSELLRVLKKPEGQIIIIGAKTNPYCCQYRVDKAIDLYQKKYPFVKLDVQYKNIDSETEYPSYIFRETLGDVTQPSQKITIHVQ